LSNSGLSAICVILIRSVTLAIIDTCELLNLGAQCKRKSACGSWDASSLLVFSEFSRKYSESLSTQVEGGLRLQGLGRRRWEVLVGGGPMSNEIHIGGRGANSACYDILQARFRAIRPADGGPVIFLQARSVASEPLLVAHLAKSRPSKVAGAGTSGSSLEVQIRRPRPGEKWPVVVGDAAV